MSARVDGAGAPLVAAGSKMGSRIEDYLEKFSVQPLLKSIAGSVVRSQPSDPVSFIISELKHWKTPQLAVQPPLSFAHSCHSTDCSPLCPPSILPIITLFAAPWQNVLRKKNPSGDAVGQAGLHGASSESPPALMQ
jgi:hypothetical protein